MRHHPHDHIYWRRKLHVDRWAEHAQFIQNYGFFVSLGNYAGTPVVVCTTCHNQHLMNVVTVTNRPGLKPLRAPRARRFSGTSGLPAGNYATMFFIRAPYNPANGMRIRHRQRKQPDGAILPSVPWWRVERNERRNRWNYVLVRLHERGGGRSFPSPFS